MINKKAIIIGGTGQIGLYLCKFLQTKNYTVYITTRKFNKKTFNKVKFLNLKKKINFINLKIFSLKNIHSILNTINPHEIYYLAGQSSVSKSFEKNIETIKSNYIGCKNVLMVIKKLSLNCKFFNASSCEIFGNQKKIISLNSKKKPISPYGKSKLLSYNITKKYREEFKIKAYNGIMFNTESYLRPKDFLIPKICLAAIKSSKNKNYISYFGNLNISREWNWCEEQVYYIWKYLQTNPKDFILSNGKKFSAKKMMDYAFNYFGLDFKKHIKISKKFKRPREIRSIKSKVSSQFKKNKIKNNYRIYGKRIIIKLIKFYLTGQSVEKVT